MPDYTRPGDLLRLAMEYLLMLYSKVFPVNPTFEDRPTKMGLYTKHPSRHAVWTTLQANEPQVQTDRPNTSETSSPGLKQTEEQDETATSPKAPPPLVDGYPDFAAPSDRCDESNREADWDRLKYMRGDDRNEEGDLNEVEIYRLLRLRFAPLARFGGPLFAGIHVSEGIPGPFYVDQQKQWLWLPWLPESVVRLRPEDAILSDEVVSRTARLSIVAENLIQSARILFDLYLEHLDRIKEKPTFPADLGVYLTDDVALVVDAIALRGKRPAE